MRAQLTPERVLSVAAIALGLTIGAGVVGSTATVPGCAAEQCQSPRFIQKPTAVLECPSGTLCYQGACEPSCASGAEGVEKCDTDDDCTSAVRPNCVDRHCSTCNAGERCIPALDICSPIRGNETDGGFAPGDAGTVRGVTPLDGGVIDGSVLSFDSGAPEMPTERIITHRLRIDVTQRIDLSTNTTSTAIRIDSLDYRNTGRVAGATVALPVFEDGSECEVRLKDSFTTPPRSIDLGNIQLQQDQGGLMRESGLTANFLATFSGGRYRVSPPPSASALIVPSTSDRLRGVEISGAGMVNLTNGRWPQGMDAPEIIVPDVFALAPASRALLADIDARNPNFALELSWTKGIRLPSSRVLVQLESDTCTLRCSFLEDSAQLRIGSRSFDPFRGPMCNGGGTRRIIVDRSSGSFLDANSNTAAGIFISATAEIALGYIGQIRL
jgi:hypothetical protein